MPLTDTKIRNAKPGTKPLKLTDGKGLYLEIRPTGTKLWRYRYRIDGKENVFAIGEYFNDRRAGHISLDDARRYRDEARALVKRGIHPAHHRKEARFTQRAEAANTFEAVAREWLAQKQAGWTRPYFCQVERFLQADAFPHIGRLPIRDVTAAHQARLALEARHRIFCRDVFRLGPVVAEIEEFPWVIEHALLGQLAFGVNPEPVPFHGAGLLVQPRRAGSISRSIARPLFYQCTRRLIAHCDRRATHAL